MLESAVGPALSVCTADCAVKSAAACKTMVATTTTLPGETDRVMSAVETLRLAASAIAKDV